jgi:hypothetical protein
MPSSSVYHRFAAAMSSATMISWLSPRNIGAPFAAVMRPGQGRYTPLWNLRFLNAWQTGTMLETSVRLLRLLSLLQARPDWSGAELADRVRLHAPAETIAEQLTPAAGLLQPDGEHTSILETGADSFHELAAFLGTSPTATRPRPDNRQAGQLE